MNEIVVTKIIEILRPFNEYIWYVKYGGSRRFSFINNPSDYDIIVICKNLEDKHICVRSFYKQYSVEELRQQYKIDFHFILQEWEDIFMLMYPLSHKNIIYKTVEYSFKEKNLNDVLKQKQQVFILYKEKIKRALLRSPIHYKYKMWYEIYSTLCIYKNNSFQLTEEQIENINILHDRKEEDFDKRVALINTIIEEISNTEEN